MKTILGALAILAATMTNTAMAETADHSSANYYLPACRDFTNHHFAREPFLQGECVGIIEGLANLANRLDPTSFFRSCVPDNASAEQVTIAVVHWADEHAFLQNDDFKAFVLLALHDTWPCKGP